MSPLSHEVCNGGHDDESVEYLERNDCIDYLQEAMINGLDAGYLPNQRNDDK